METVNVAEAKSRFSELISRAATGERFMIQRRQRAVAALVGAVDLERLEHMAQLARRLASALGQDASLLNQVERGEVHPAMAAFGLWKDQADLEFLAAEIAEDRQRHTDRPGIDL